MTHQPNVPIFWVGQLKFNHNVGKTLQALFVKLNSIVNVADPDSNGLWLHMESINLLAVLEGNFIPHSIT